VGATILEYEKASSVIGIGFKHFFVRRHVVGDHEALEPHDRSMVFDPRPQEQRIVLGFQPLINGKGPVNSNDLPPPLSRHPNPRSST
jgi:hypothetical protein